MSIITPLVPRQRVPALEIATVNGERWKVQEQNPESFSLVVFYRGYHCPICRKQLSELERKLPDFAERGVNVIAISSDTQERAKATKENWRLPNLMLGYGLDLDKAREWGLYISTSRGKTSLGIEEPARFSEPALYLIRPDGTLFFGTVQTMPFARPHADDLLSAIDYVLKNNYPARGEVIDHKKAVA